MDESRLESLPLFTGLSRKERRAVAQRATADARVSPRAVLTVEGLEQDIVIEGEIALEQ